VSVEGFVRSKLDAEGFRHSKRVADRARDAAPGRWKRDIWQAGLLHDVFEDSDATIPEAREAGFTELAIDAALALTRSPDETYFDYIRSLVRLRGAVGHVAVAVKRADIDDHLDPVRVNRIPASLVKRYRKAEALLDES